MGTSELFDPLVLAFQSSLTDIAGQVGATEEGFVTLFGALEKLGEPRAGRVANELVVVLRRFQQAVTAEQARLITLQICVLLGVVLPSMNLVRALLAQEGAAHDAQVIAAAELILSNRSSQPVGGDVRSPASLFNLLLGTTRNRKPHGGT